MPLLKVSRYKTWARARLLKSLPGDSMGNIEALWNNFLLKPEDCDNIIHRPIELFPWDKIGLSLVL